MAAVAVTSTARGLGHAVAAITAATTYYVSNGGLDSNNGKTTSTPWKTVGFVNTIVFNPGDTILFQGGQSFTDTDLEVYSNGIAGQPVTFGSYGTGQALLSQAYFSGYNYLTFNNLKITHVSAMPFNGNGNNITVSNCLIDGQSNQTTSGSVQLGASAKGNNWTFTNNTVQNTGLSGIQWYGDTLSATGNTITNVGLRSPGSANASVSYNAHGFYVGQTGFPGTNATITGNTIFNPPGSEAMMESGISQRSRGGNFTGNIIHNCLTGIDFYESDATGGSSTWSSNTIYNTTGASMYVQGPTGGDYNTSESFTIRLNVLGPVLGGVGINVLSSYTTGTVTVNSNQWIVPTPTATAVGVATAAVIIPAPAAAMLTPVATAVGKATVAIGTPQPVVATATALSAAVAPVKTTAATAGSAQAVAKAVSVVGVPQPYFFPRVGLVLTGNAYVVTARATRPRVTVVRL